MWPQRQTGVASSQGENHRSWKRQGTACPWETSEGVQLCQHFHQISGPEIIGEPVSVVFLSHPVCGTLLQKS